MRNNRPEPTDCPGCKERVLPIKETANVIHCPNCGVLDKRTAPAVAHLRDGRTNEERIEAAIENISERMLEVSKRMAPGKSLAEVREEVENDGE